MTSGDWIGIGGLVVTVLMGGIGWLTYIAVNVGKIVQKIDGFKTDLNVVRKEVKEIDGRVDKLERRAIPAH